MLKLSRQKHISKELLRPHMDLRQFTRSIKLVDTYNYIIFIECNYMPSVMRPDPPNSVVDYDYFLDI